MHVYQGKEMLLTMQSMQDQHDRHLRSGVDNYYFSPWKYLPDSLLVMRRLYSYTGLYFYFYTNKFMQCRPQFSMYTGICHVKARDLIKVLKYIFIMWKQDW